MELSKASRVNFCSLPSTSKEAAKRIEKFKIFIFVVLADLPQFYSKFSAHVGLLELTYNFVRSILEWTRLNPVESDGLHALHNSILSVTKAEEILVGWSCSWSILSVSVIENA